MGDGTNETGNVDACASRNMSRFGSTVGICTLTIVELQECYLVSRGTVTQLANYMFIFQPSHSECKRTGRLT